MMLSRAGLGGTHVDTIHDVATRSPSILMIEGREYALYQGFLERTKLVDVKLLWLDGAKNLALLLAVALMTVSFTLPDSSLWFAFGFLAAGLAFAAVSSFMDSHSVAVVPVSVVEKERQGLTSTLFIFTRPQRPPPRIAAPDSRPRSTPTWRTSC
jgi:hypothetical protein